MLRIFVIVTSLLILTCCDEDNSHEQVYSYPNLTDSPLPRINPVKSSHIIGIPLYPRAYNPGFAEFEGEKYLAVRIDSNSISGQTFVSGILLTTLNDNYEVSRDYEMLDAKIPSQTHRMEDPRLFVFQSQLWIVANGPTADSRNRMYISAIDLDHNDGPRVSGWQLVGYPESPGTIEKNWSPFVYNDELYFVYSVKTHAIIKVDPATGEATEVSSTPGFTWEFGGPRGGSQTLEYGEHYLHVFHSSKDYRFLDGKKRRIYVMGAYLFEKEPPFTIVKYTPLPIIGEDFYAGNNPKHFVFPSGAVIDGETLIVASGVNDDQVMISEIDLAKTVAEMVDL